MSNSDSLCNSCAAPMCRWLLKMKVSEGMEVAKEDRVNYGKKGGIQQVYVVKKCSDCQKVKWRKKNERLRKNNSRINKFTFERYMQRNDDKRKSRSICCNRRTANTKLTTTK